MCNKYFMSLILLASTSTVFAMPYDSLHHNGILEVGLTGGGFAAGTDNTAYGINASSLGAAPYGRLATAGNILKDHPRYKFGGTVLVGYYFPDSTINVELSYTGSHTKLEDAAAGTITPNLIPPTIWELNSSVSVASSSYDFDYDYLNIEIGSLTRVNCNGLLINPQLGLSFARLKNNQVIHYAGGDLVDNSTAVTRDSSFNGFGPSLGLDIRYIFCRPFLITGNFRYNALVGNVNSSYNFASTLDGSMAIPISSKNTIANLFQSEIAFGFDFNIKKIYCGSVMLGYQFTKSINNSEQILFVDDFSESNFFDTLLNSSLHGYFARLTMNFDV